MGDAALAPPMAANAQAVSPAPALLEVVDRDGLVRQSWRIERWPVTIGRALDNTIVLSDPHVAAHHATIDVVPGGDAVPAKVVVAAGETKNGIVVGRRDRDDDRTDLARGARAGTTGLARAIASSSAPHRVTFRCGRVSAASSSLCSSWSVLFRPWWAASSS